MIAASPMKQASRLKRTALRSVAFVFAASFAGSASGQTTTWVNGFGVGSWFVPANWNFGVPQPGQFAFVRNDGLAIVDAPGAATSYLTLGGSGGLTGYANVNGAGRLALGERLIVNNGTFQVLSGGGASAGITELGDVSGTGTLRVTGATSYFNAGVSYIGVPLISSSGAGILRVESGGRVDSSQVLTRDANITVTGANSLWYITSYLVLGIGAQASNLAVADGGTVSAISASIGSNGHATVSGGSVFNVYGSGAALVVGTAGTGTFRAQSGSTIFSNAGVVGDGTSTGAGNGNVVITGANTRWYNNGVLSLGGDTSSASPRVATGEVSVLNGGYISTVNSYVGNRPGTYGSAILQGATSSWVNSGDVAIGNLGDGGLTVGTGATFSSVRGHIALGVGTVGSAVISDAGSRWLASGSFFVGNGGSGALQVLAGGLASTQGNSYLGFSTGASGSAYVIGANSTWNTAVKLYVGGNGAAVGGTGYMLIADGGIVNTGGVQLWSNGTIDLQNATTFTGTINSVGGNIRTFGDTGLANNLTLDTGGLKVFNFTAGSTANFTGNISGAGGLVKSSVGKLLVSGANTYTGGTLVAAGILHAWMPGSLPGYDLPGVVVVNDGAMLELYAGGPGQWTAADIDLLQPNVAFQPGSTLGIDTTDGDFSYANLGGIQHLAKFGSNVLSLGGDNAYTGSTLVSGGTLQVVGSIASSSGVDVVGGTFDAAGDQTVKTLAVGANGYSLISAGVLTVGDGTTAAALDLGQGVGQLDIGARGLVIDYVENDPLPDSDAALISVREQIAYGRNGGTWDGRGVMSSVAIGDVTQAVGYALATETPAVVNGVFMGKAGIDASSVVVRVTFAGDATLDGDVDFDDLLILAQNYNLVVSETTQSWWTHGDSTYDGIVNFDDLLALAQNYGSPAALTAQQAGALTATFAADWALATSLLPEPVTAGAMFAGVPLTIRRRRQR